MPTNSLLQTMKTKYDGYLTEEKLGLLLDSIAARIGATVVRQWRLGHLRCDFAVIKASANEPSVVYEFAGFRHYSSHRTQLLDDEKQRMLIALNIKLVRIPYFVQMTTETLALYIKTKHVHEVICKYLHGFIDPRALVPADFNERGVTRFLADLMLLSADVARQIWASLTIQQLPTSLVPARQKITREKNVPTK